MFFARDREHVDPYYNLLGILKFENIYRLEVSLFRHKRKNDKSNSPAVLLNILTPASETHSYNTSMLQIKTSLNSQQQKSGNLFHQNLTVFHTCSSKSGIKDSSWPLKSDYSLTERYYSTIFRQETMWWFRTLFSLILACSYVFLPL